MARKISHIRRDQDRHLQDARIKNIDLGLHAALPVCKEIFEHERPHFSTLQEIPKFPEDISGLGAREKFPFKKNCTLALKLMLETRLECVGIVLVDAGEPMLLNQG